MSNPTHLDVDVWVGSFPSEDFLWGYLEYWLEGDPLPPAERDESSDEPQRPMCQFSLDHDCSYYNTETRSYSFADQPCSLLTLLQNGLPEGIAAEAALRAESALPEHRPFNAFVALWDESFDSPRTLRRQHYELHYLGRFRHTA